MNFTVILTQTNFQSRPLFTRGLRSMPDPTLYAALKAKKLAFETISAEVALVDVRIKEYHSITEYMEVCQQANKDSLFAAGMQLSQMISYTKAKGGLTVDRCAVDLSEFEDILEEGGLHMVGSVKDED